MGTPSGNTIRIHLCWFGINILFHKYILFFQDWTDVLLLPGYKHVLSKIHAFSLLGLACITGFAPGLRLSLRLSRPALIMLKGFNCISYALVYAQNFGEGLVLGFEWMDLTVTR